MPDFKMLTRADMVEAIFPDGSDEGKYVTGWTKNMMIVSLKTSDLPFSVRDLPVVFDNYAYNLNMMYRITEGQRDALMAALAAKVEASEDRSKTAVVGMIAERNPD